jgi:PBSX family phage terminase large subunit
MASIKPTVPQYKYITSSAKFPAFVAGFGAGKTEAAILRSVIGLLSCPNINRAFYQPTYDLIRMIAFPRFEEILTEMEIPYRLSKSPLNQLNVAGYGIIYFRSMENVNRIVGYEVGDSDIDELDTLKKEDAAKAWRQILARNRQYKENGKNTIGVTTTPEGFKFVYETWVKNPKEGYEIIQAPTYSNPHLPEDYIKNLQDMYTDNLLNSYIEGEFVNLVSGSVYNSYDRVKCMTNEVIQPYEALHIGCDFNVTKQAATIYVVRNGHEYHAVDELYNMYDTPEMIRIIKDKWYDKGHPVYIYPDASGKSRKTVNASTSDIAMLQQEGFRVLANASNPAVKDRVMAMNNALEKGRVKINAHKCPQTADCLEQQAYNSNGEPDKSTGYDHQNDATTYPIAYLMPIRKPVANVDFRFAM